MHVFWLGRKKTCTRLFLIVLFLFFALVPDFVDKYSDTLRLHHTNFVLLFIVKTDDFTHECQRNDFSQLRINYSESFYLFSYFSICKGYAGKHFSKKNLLFCICLIRNITSKFTFAENAIVNTTAAREKNFLQHRHSPLSNTPTLWKKK